MAEGNVLTILKPDAKAVLATNNAMAHLWRLVLYRVRPGFNRWDVNLIEHIDAISKGSSDVKRRNDKSNLSKSLAKDVMSWATLVEGLLVLNFNEIKIAFTMTRDGISKTFNMPIRTRIQAANNNEHFGKRDVLVSAMAISNMWPAVLAERTTDVTWESLLVEYSIEQAEYENNMNVDAEVTAASIRAGLRKKLKRSVISWDAFIQGVRSLKIESIRINLELCANRSVHVALLINLHRE